MTPRRMLAVAGRAAALALAALSATAVAATPQATAATALVGLFTIAPGSCSGTTVSGSYFRMILQGGDADGPFLSNSDSPCSNQSYTPMSPGTDGGLASGSYQPQPSPAFDADGNSLADRVIAPADFYGVRYGVSTQPVDPQTGDDAPAPSITVSGSSLSGDVAAVSVSWNNQYFNQGSPKPDGTYPGDTTAVTGTYDAASGSYSLTWTSQIVGGPFNGFSGLWVLTGRFVPSGAQAAAPASSSAAASGGALSSASGSKSSSVRSDPMSASESASSSPATSSPQSQTTAPGSSPVRPGVLTVRTTTRSGLHPPRWLVVLVTALGVAALGALVLFDRRIAAARNR